jgi:hypothetical protein
MPLRISPLRRLRDATTFCSVATTTRFLPAALVWKAAYLTFPMYWLCLYSKERPRSWNFPLDNAFHQDLDVNMGYKFFHISHFPSSLKQISRNFNKKLWSIIKHQVLVCYAALSAEHSTKLYINSENIHHYTFSPENSSGNPATYLIFRHTFIDMIHMHYIKEIFYCPQGGQF